VLDGGDGADLADYAFAASGVSVVFSNLAGASGEAAGDSFVSIESLTGSDFNDTLSWDDNANILFGGAGDDTLSGNGGADWLLAGDGADTLNGGAGNDILIGYGGGDTFVFATGSGADRIVEFGSGAGDNDVIRLSGFGAAFDTFAEVSAVGSQSGADAVFNFGGGDTLTLQNVTLASLASGDFLFV
jgi:Ca2+-binding RTX toxin-like protein